MKKQIEARIGVSKLEELDKLVEEQRQECYRNGEYYPEDFCKFIAVVEELGMSFEVSMSKSGVVSMIEEF